MLKRLRFQNWRSLQNVEIKDLTPITVFIGANSTGKTNIIDALRFLQYVHSRGSWQSEIVSAVRYKWGGVSKVKTVGTDPSVPVILEVDIQSNVSNSLLTWTSEMNFTGEDSPFVHYHPRLFDHTLQRMILDYPVDLPLNRRHPRAVIWDEGEEFERQVEYRTIERYIDTYFWRRMQIFRELFMPQLTMPIGDFDPGNLYVVEEDGSNIVFMLDNMFREQQNLYERLQEDLTWLLHHVETIQPEQEERELKLTVREKSLPVTDAKSISTGTARLIAMLTAYYTLDMEARPIEHGTRNIVSPSGREWNIDVNAMPGLVVIEEPDVALNPGLLKNFVEQLRAYTDSDQHRQFILTTHNPAFLNYFRPEEVRVLDRDEQGHTIVRSVPNDISDIWLDEYGLGEVWTTNSFGGLQV